MNRPGRILLLSLIISTISSIACAQGWEYIAPMHHDRADPNAVVLQDGRIFVMGGADASETLRSCEIYDPATNSWSEADSMSISRRNFRALLLPDGRVFVCGGLTVLGNNPGTVTTNTCEIYDPATGHWHPTASMASARATFGACLVPGHRVAIMGGINANDASYPKTFELFDYVSETMTELPPLLFPTYLVKASYDSVGDCVLLPGGIQGGFGGAHLLSTQKYSFETNSWSLVDSMIQSEGEYANSIVSPITHNLFLFQGALDYMDNTTGLVQQLDPISGHWSAAGSLSPCGNARDILMGDSVITVGGYNRGPLSTCSWYDLRTLQGYPAPSLKEPVVTHCLVTTSVHLPEEPCLEHRKIYIIGGNTTDGRIINECEVLDMGLGAASSRIATSPASLTSFAGPCAPTNFPITISAKSCQPISFVGARTAKGDSVEVSGVSLPETLDTASHSITLTMLKKDTASHQELILYFLNGRDTIEQALPFTILGSVSRMVSFANLSLAATPCTSLDTMFAIQNPGCDTLTVSEVGLRGTSELNVVDTVLHIPPGGTSSISLQGKNFSPGVISASLSMHFSQFGESWDSIAEISIKVANLNPITVQAILKDVKKCTAGRHDFNAAAYLQRFV